MKSYAQQRQPRGVLLVEALVSFAIFLVASVAFYGLLANARRAETKARQIVVANGYARQLMEGQRLKGYASLAAGSTTGSKTFNSDRAGVSGRTKMTSTVTVYEGPGAGVRSVVVAVTWNQGRVLLESYVTQ